MVAILDFWATFFKTFLIIWDILFDKLLATIHYVRDAEKPEAVAILDY
jgi:hypothetical protein